MVQRFLVVPLLAPWVLVLLVAALNPRPALSLRLLVWTSPALPIGTWLALVSSGGALLSLSATVVTLQGRRPVPFPSPGARAEAGAGRWSRRSRPAAGVDLGDDWQADDPGPASQPPVAAAGPGRAPGDVAPTVSVPFRVIRRGSAARTPQATPTPSAGLDGWADQQDDDW